MNKLLKIKNQNNKLESLKRRAHLNIDLNKGSVNLLFSSKKFLSNYDVSFSNILWVFDFIITLFDRTTVQKKRKPKI